MEFRILSKEEYQEFYEVSSCRNFFQSINMYDRYINLGYESYLVGLTNKNKVLVAGLIVAKKSKLLNYKVFKCHRGPLLLDNNYYYLDIFLTKLEYFLKEKKGIYLYISPYLNKPNNLIIDLLDKKKYKYLGGYDQVDYMYVLDTDNKSIKEVFNNYKANTKNNINKAINRYKLEIKKYNYLELEEFKSICDMASDKHNFIKQPLDYYQSMYKYFKDKVLFLGAKLIKNNYLTNLDIELNKLKNNYNNCSNNKKKNEYKDKINNIELEIAKANKLPKEVIIAVGMFILDSREVVYLFSGCDSKYNKFNGSYFLQNYMINYAIENNYERYNFYGISRDLNDGVYQFKKGFNGYIMETIGTYVVSLRLMGTIIKFGQFVGRK